MINAGAGQSLKARATARVFIFAAAFGDHLLLLVVLVVLKTFVDLAMQGRERQKYLDDEGAPIMTRT